MQSHIRASLNPVRMSKPSIPIFEIGGLLVNWKPYFLYWKTMQSPRLPALRTACLFAVFLGLLILPSALVAQPVLDISLTSAANYGWLWWTTLATTGLALVAAMVIVWNVQLRRRVQAQTEKVRFEEERFRQFAEAAADFFWELDAELKVSYVSPGYQDILGLAPAEVLGRTRREIYAGRMDERSKWETHFRQLEEHLPYEDFEYTWMRPDGEVRLISHSGKPFFDGERFLGYRGAGRDVTESHRLAQELAYQATHDMLTGLVNRHEFERRMQMALLEAKEMGIQHALCYLDLDQFKIINDTCGHRAGDALLGQLGSRLQEECRKPDTLARLGGDEFGLLIDNASTTQAIHVAEKLRHIIQEFRFYWQGRYFGLGVSIGLVPISEYSQSVETLLSAADTACYAAKDEGRNRIHLYHEDDEDMARRYREMRVVSKIGEALEQGRFRLNWQPIAPIVNGSGHGSHYEVLIRMEDEDGSLISPGVFLPAAERYNLSTKLDRWVIDTAFEWLENHPGHLDQLSLCSINLSGHFMGDRDSLSYVVHRLNARNIPPERICFEITETAAIANLSSANHFIRRLKDMGCYFALDDFGSGLSSFGYLKSLPVDYLKIDGAFIRAIAEDQIDLAMVKSINDVGHVLGKKTVAEFVESQAILDRLRDMGVDYAQGYFIGRPQPMENMLH